MEVGDSREMLVKYTVPISVDTFKTLGPYNWTPFVGAPFLVDTLSLCVS